MAPPVAKNRAADFIENGYESRSEGDKLPRRKIRTPERVKGFLVGTLEARRNAELEKLRECMHCEDSECFRERVGRGEDREKTVLDDGASLEDDLVSLCRRDKRVNRRMACPRDGIVDDILREMQLQLEIPKTLERREGLS